ncbi:hypothetical protein LCGC14_1589530, partial [marine sediment metagenome]
MVIRRYIFLAGILLCGTYLSPTAWDRALTSRHIIWCALTLMLFVSLYKSVDLSVLNRKIFWFGGLYVGCAFISGFYAVNHGDWIYSSLRALLAVTFLFVAVSVLDEKKLAKTMVLLGLFYFAYGQYEFISNSVHKCIGVMCNKNPWSVAQFLCLPFCVFLIKEKGFWRWISICVGVGLLANIFILTTRSVVLAVGVASLCLLNRKTLKYVIPILVIAVVYLISFRWVYIIDTISMTERWQAWRVTLTMIYENPLGVGAGNWWLTLPKYGQNLDYKFFTNNIFRHPHCDYLWVLSEVGVIGFIGYIGMFFTSLYYAFKSKRTYLIAGLVGYMAIMLFSFPNERAFSSMVLMLFMALAVKGYHVKPCTKRVKDAYFKYTSDMRVFRMTGVNIILLLVFMLVVLGYRHKALIYNSRLRSTTWDNVVKETNGYSMFSSVTFTGVPFHWFRGLAYLQQKNYV